jgi:release factor glutamine methyltransferase
MMTLQQLLKWGRERLSSAGVAEWSLDAWYLLEYADGCTKNEYFLHPDREVSHAKRQLYEELIEKRSLHIPLQHLTGSQEFMGLSFYVNEHVLIPRQDTEILVEKAGKYMMPKMEILDLCTGSGCILLSILTLYPGLNGTGADLSEKALEVAKRNRANLNLEEKARLVHSDLFAQIEGSFDRILSNPPYIPTKTVDTLMEEVRDHEPRMALDGLEDGLYFYRKIVEQSPAYLKPGGMLFLEIGYDQAAAVTALMEKDFTGVQVVKDLAGLDRVVYGTLRS